jgi:hypothetical protein
MKQLALLALLALVPVHEPQAQVRVSGGVTVRFGDGHARVEPRVRIDIGGRRDHRRAPHGRVVVTKTPPRPRGHYEIVRERVWVPPVYQHRRDHCGRIVRVCVRRGYWKTIERRVWVPAPRCETSSPRVAPRHVTPPRSRNSAGQGSRSPGTRVRATRGSGRAHRS